MSCIVFDQQTAKEIVVASAFPIRDIQVSEEGDPFTFALQRERSVLIFPGQNSQEALVLRMMRAPQPENRPAPESKNNTVPPPSQDRRTELREPRGILGLDGDAVYLDEEPEPERSWWQKLFRN